MRNATLDLQEMRDTIARLADLAEAWLSSDLYAAEVADALVSELRGLGMTIEARNVVRS